MCGTSESSALLEAARSNDVATAVGVLEKQPRLAYRAQQWGGQTAWHLAAKEGHAGVLQGMAATILQLSLAQLKQLSKHGSTANEVITSMVQQQDSKCLAPLHLACIKGRSEAAAVLMQLGANPFVMDSVGRTPLHYAASWGFADCINTVLHAHSGPPKEEWAVTWPNNESTQLVDVQNAAGFTPLHYAVWVGRREAIQALASYDASLKVVNLSNDYDWIKVGTGNTPLHLAAFGGDFDVVKLLLAAHVQTLSAGAEALAAAHGQWGERHADDVRHMRNRRGLMAYHIAVHKGFQHLAELLHPDIPYTFIFSNDDMEVGSVRMYGPPRLMVVAAKALQQKLVDELAAVARGTKSSTTAAAGQAAAVHADATLSPAGMATASAGVQLQPQPGVSAKQQQEAAAAAAAAAAPLAVVVPTADAVDAAAVAAAGREPSSSEIVSPFAAKSQRKWTTSTLSDGTSMSHDAVTVGDLVSAVTQTTAPAAGIAASGQSDVTGELVMPQQPTPAGPATSLISDTDISTTSVVEPTIMGEAVLHPGSSQQPIGPEPTAAIEDILHFHAGHDLDPAALHAVLSPNATAPPLLLGATQSTAGSDSTSFAGFNVGNGRQGWPGMSSESSACGIPAAVGSAAGTSSAHALPQRSATSETDASMSISTVPGSTTAVGGTPAGSVVLPEAAASSSNAAAVGRKASTEGWKPFKFVPGMSASWSRGALQAAGTAAGMDNDSSSTSAVQGADVAAAGSAGAGVPVIYPAGSSSPAALGAVAVGAAAVSAYARKWQGRASAVDVTTMPRPPGKHRRAQSSAGVLSRRDSGKTADVQKQQGSWNKENVGGVASKGDNAKSWLKSMEGSLTFKHTGSKRNILDDVLPPSAVQTTEDDDDQADQHEAKQFRRGSLAAVMGGQGSASGSQISPPPDNVGGQQQGLQDGPENGDIVGDNPLDVMLANRANIIGENPEAMRQQLVLMKLASGTLNFNAAANALNSALNQQPPEMGHPGGSRLSSFTTQSATGPKRMSLGNRPSIGAAGASSTTPPRSGAQTPTNGQPSPWSSADSAATAAAAAKQAAAESNAAGGEATAGAGNAGLLPTTSKAGSLDMVTQQQPSSATRQLIAQISAGARSSSLRRSQLGPQPSLQRLLSGCQSRRLEEDLSAAVADVGPVAGSDITTAASNGSAAATASAGGAADSRGSEVADAAGSSAGSNGLLQVPTWHVNPPTRISNNAADAANDYDDDDESICEICFDAQAVVQLQACHHTLCLGCCKEMCKLHHFKPALCPYCRQIICGFKRAEIAAPA